LRVADPECEVTAVTITSGEFSIRSAPDLFVIVLMPLQQSALVLLRYAHRPARVASHV
jgi:hypothetical protein